MQWTVFMNHKHGMSEMNILWDNFLSFKCQEIWGFIHKREAAVKIRTWYTKHIKENILCIVQNNYFALFNDFYLMIWKLKKQTNKVLFKPILIEVLMDWQESFFFLSKSSISRFSCSKNISVHVKKNFLQPYLSNSIQ